MSKDKFLMYLTMIMCVAIIINSIIHKDNNLVQNLMVLLAYWMPSPISTSTKQKDVYIAPLSSNNEEGF